MGERGRRSGENGGQRALLAALLFVCCAAMGACGGPVGQPAPVEPTLPAAPPDSWQLAMAHARSAEVAWNASVREVVERAKRVDAGEAAPELSAGMEAARHIQWVERYARLALDMSTPAEGPDAAEPLEPLAATLPTADEANAARSLVGEGVKQILERMDQVCTWVASDVLCLDRAHNLLRLELVTALATVPLSSTQPPNTAAEPSPLESSPLRPVVPHGFSLLPYDPLADGLEARHLESAHGSRLVVRVPATLMPPYSRGDVALFLPCDRLSSMLPALGLDRLTPLTQRCAYERDLGCRLAGGTPDEDGLAVLYPGTAIWALRSPRDHRQDDERVVEAAASSLVSTSDVWALEITLRATYANRGASVGVGSPPPTLEGALVRDRSRTRWDALRAPSSPWSWEALSVTRFRAPDSNGFELEATLHFSRTDGGWLVNESAGDRGGGLAESVCNGSVPSRLEEARALVHARCPALVPAADWSLGDCGRPQEYHWSGDCRATVTPRAVEVTTHFSNHATSGGSRFAFDLEGCHLCIISYVTDARRIVTWSSSRRADFPPELSTLLPWSSVADGQRFAEAPILSSGDSSRRSSVYAPPATLAAPWRFAGSLPPPHSCASLVRADNIRTTLASEFEGAPAGVPATAETISLRADFARAIRREVFGRSRGIPMRSFGGMYVQHGGLLLPVARHGHHVFFTTHDYESGTTLAVHDTSRDRSRFLLHLADGPSDVSTTLVYFDGVLLVAWIGTEEWSLTPGPGLVYAVDLATARGAILYPQPVHGQAPAVSAEGLEFAYDTDQGERCTARLPLDELQRMLAE